MAIVPFKNGMHFSSFPCTQCQPVLLHILYLLCLRLCTLSSQLAHIRLMTSLTARRNVLQFCYQKLLIIFFAVFYKYSQHSLMWFDAVWYDMPFDHCKTLQNIEMSICVEFVGIFFALLTNNFVNWSDRCALRWEIFFFGPNIQIHRYLKQKTTTTANFRVGTFGVRIRFIAKQTCT